MNGHLRLASRAFMVLAALSFLFFTALPASPVHAAVKTASVSGNWNTTGTWSPSGVPGSADDVIIANGATVDFNVSGTATVLSLTVNSGGKLTFATQTDGNSLTVTGNVLNNGTIAIVNQTGGARVHTLNVGGNFSNNGAFTTTDPAGGTAQDDHLDVVLNGTAAQTLGGTTATQFRDLTISNTSAAGVTATNNFSVVHITDPADYAGYTVTVNANATFNAGAYVISGTGAFTLSSGGTLGIGSTAGITSSGATGNIQTTTRNFNTGANYTYYGTSAQHTGNGLPATVNNLTISNTGGDVTLDASVAISATLQIGSGAVLAPIAAGIISGTGGTLTGNGTAKVTRTAVTADFSSQYTIANKTLTNLTVSYAGAAAQIVSALTYGGLKINNASGVTLGGNATVSGILTLTSGTITTSASTLIVAIGGSISGGSNSSYVKGYLRKNFSIGSGQSFTFPVGDASAYTPVTLLSLNVGTGGYLTVSVTSGDHPNIATSGIDSTMSVNRYSTLTSGGGFTATYIATFNYLSGDLDGGAVASAFTVRRYSSGAWSISTVIGTPTTTATTISGETGFGDFAIGNSISPPSISAVGLYQTDHVTSVTAMSPQTEYAMKVTVSNAGTLAILNTVKVTIFYDADGVYAPGDVPSSGNTQTAAILTCTVGSTPSWSIAPSTNTTWSIISGNSVQPTLTNTTGDFWFHFKAGKVATATAGGAKWHIYAKATGAGGTADNHQDNRTMNWYGEVTVNTPGVNFGTVSLGSDFSSNTQTSISVTYICNGNYSQQIKISSPWTGSGNSVLLNAAGSPGEGEFSLKAYKTATLSSAILVSTSYITIGSGTQTSENGNTESANTLWLKLGALGMPALTYNGTIYYGIAQ